MKISNLKKKITSATLNESLKSKFGFTLNLDIDLPKAQSMLKTMNESLAAFRNKVGERATSSKKYTEKLLVAETLTKFIQEKEKSMKIERRSMRLKSKLQENQAQEAEVVLAAKDMVDGIQGMIEDLGEMQNEQLQPLVDSIRNVLGEEVAMSFESSMTSALSSSMDAMRQARIGADSASRILTGEESMGDDLMGMGDEMGMDPMGDDPMADPMGSMEPEPDLAGPDATAMGRGTRDAELDLSGL